MLQMDLELLMIIAAHFHSIEQTRDDYGREDQCASAVRRQELPWIAISADMKSSLIQHAVGAHQQGRLDRAANLYEQILQRDPQNFAALQLLGTLRGQQGRYLEAIRLTETALRMRPDDFGTLANYGSVLMAAGRHLDALDPFDRALTIKPDFFEAFYNRAIALAHLQAFCASRGQL